MPPAATYTARPAPSSVARPGWAVGSIIGIAAAIAATAVMFWLRTAYQIRTLPERVMEWVLLFVSPDTVEQGISQFGAQAKVYALYVAIVVMVLILVALGAAAVRLASSPWVLLAIGPALYLLATGIILPLTGAGPFGTNLLQDWRLVNAGYLAVAMTYATLLVLGRLVALSPDTSAVVRSTAPDVAVSRRAALGSLGTTLLAAAATFWFGRQSGSVGSNLPLAQLPTPAQASGASSPPTALPRPAAPAAASGSGSVASSGGLTAPTVAGPTAASVPATTVAAVAPKPAAPAAPTAAATAAPTAAAAEPTAAAAPPTPPAPTPPPAAPAVARLPVPPQSAKQLTRDQDGSTTAGAREPGTLAPLITSTEAHYHVTKNPVADPVIKPEEWSLALEGEVNNPVRLDYALLRQLPTVEIAKTLECVSNLTDKCELVPFGCELIGTAAWKGVRLVDILDLAGGLKPGVVSVSLIAEDEFSSTIPPEVALDPNTVLAYEMNGQVLPYEHGYPARLLTPGRYGYKSPKWIRVIRPSGRYTPDWYSQRNWNKDGIVRTMTRIDVPAPAATLPAGTQRVAGIAYASDRGVSSVEYSADGGQTWQPANFLEPQPGHDAWVRWEGSFELPAGATVNLVSRAIDGRGVLQEETFSLAQPDGGAGWHHLTVTGA
ncbi:MAG: molybdopterin-dependent oxidoreductase [Chloroflexota bacterium]